MSKGNIRMFWPNIRFMTISLGLCRSDFPPPEPYCMYKRPLYYSEVSALLNAHKEGALQMDWARNLYFLCQCKKQMLAIWMCDFGTALRICRSKCRIVLFHERHLHLCIKQRLFSKDFLSKCGPNNTMSIIRPKSRTFSHISILISAVFYTNSCPRNKAVLCRLDRFIQIRLVRILLK